MENRSSHRFDRFLIESDRNLIAEKAERWSFDKDQIIIREGAHVQSLFILRKGVVRVEKDHRYDPIVLDHLNEGEFMGIMSFLDDAPINVSLVADGPVEVDHIRLSVLNSLLESTPGMAIRLYRSLASLLVIRLRECMERVQP
ncbi:MAG: cyclic nucleotide-binding domain-containing protein [Magnetococcales bacterium]|nr:cyclic nucleotide-binding domain-containing protein [Magnetococcales bacterium]